jgi:2'-5' RNA ligase
VLWAGLEDPAPLTTLAEAVRRSTAGLGHPAEERAYHPHLTVARAPRPRPVSHLVDELGARPLGPAWTVDDVALVASDTRPDGAVHTVWARRGLGP